MSAPRVKQSLYISVDIEADGPIPGTYSMLSFGAAVAGTQDVDGYTAADPEKLTFYRELRPIGERQGRHALDDAIEQAELFANLMAWPGSSQ
ncbi:hypothetical protein R6V09_37490 [Streptomyces sp. W16]|uniref:hypothetical protein n=1 Tax=Streptomyces sp. W16 TaxID=3076631 RepID=UPI00295AA36E|nr:hypothetical protein [Streptomyces sp. W16]MDV9175798.1 hypothetical protein [Streptomyces sp. W16]